jgi:hypothetical protein
VGIFPADWAASVWNQTPRSRVIFDTSSMGCKVPVSLLACIRETRMVLSPMAFLTSLGSTWPVRSTGRTVTRAPRVSKNRQGLITAGCSVAAVMMWLPFSRSSKKAPFMAKLFDSLPPLVKTISEGWQPSRSATWARARSTAWRAGAPAQWLADGLPWWSSR